MNINIDNYEAYLLDYLDGKLSPNDAEQLQAFVTAHGLDWGELTEALPRLETPEMEFVGKERLKKKGVAVPLYVKIASVAAGAGLLLAIGLWPEKQLPKVEPVAELKPIEASLTVAEMPVRIVSRPIVQSVERQCVKKEIEKTLERTAVEVVAPLPSMKPMEVFAFTKEDYSIQPDLDMLRCRLEAQQAFAYLLEGNAYEEEMPTSWVGRNIYRMTEGRHASIGGLINAGLHIAKKEIKKASADVALATYYRAGEHMEEAKEHWQEKREE